jgi:acyl-CoA thioesterase YciA
LNKDHVNDELVLRTIAMPADANPNGDIFGGWLLGQMDLAGSVIAIRLARGRVATVGVEAMKFLAPVLIGDEVSHYAEATKIGNTSVAVKITTFARRRHEDEFFHVTEGLFTYVAIDENRQKRLIPRSEN